MRRYAPVLLIIWLLVGGAVHAAASRPSDLFDPARHMRVSEVKAGMTGYGLTVFKGTKIERFDVEVVSVLRNFNPQADVILVNLKGANLQHTGSIAGMSGSPIYLHDDQGRARLAGAFAYGWPLMKDPVGGVQPIEYMLAIKPKKPTVPPPPTTTAQARAWDIGNAMLLPGMDAAPATYPFAGVRTMAANPLAGFAPENPAQLRPLAIPLMTSALSPKLIDQLSPVLRASGMVPLQAGGGSGSGAETRLEPGAVMAVPMLTGDIEMTAIGTCTEVLGDQVFGFGHPFNNEGPVAMPMGAGEINGVIANLMTSFKLGAINQTVGTIFADENSGVAGTIGKSPPLIPIELRVKYADGSEDRTYKFNAAWHPKFTPLLSATAIVGAVTGIHDLPEYHTIDYDVNIEFANGQKLHIANSMVNAQMPELFFGFGGPMIVAANNPYEQVSVTKVAGTVIVTPKARDATILWVNAPRLKYRPGETLKAFVNYRPFRADDAIMPIEFELPRDLPEGVYQFTISGWEQFLSDERTAKPFRFTAESVDDVFGVLRDLAGFRHDAVYMRLQRAPDGIAIGRTAMPNLPSSRREVLIGAGRSNTTPFVSSTTKIIPAGHLLDGAAQFEVTIDKNAHVETGAGKPPRHDSPPPTPATPPPARIEPKPQPKPEIPIGTDKEPN